MRIALAPDHFIDTPKVTCYLLSHHSAVSMYDKGDELTRMKSLSTFDDSSKKLMAIKTYVFIVNSPMRHSEEFEENFPRWRKKEVIYHVFTVIFARTESDRNRMEIDKIISAAGFGILNADKKYGASYFEGITEIRLIPRRK